MKKIATFLLALVMILSLATTALADEVKNNSITINNAKPGETYKLYKLLDLTVNLEAGEKGAYAYTINSDWADFFAKGAGASYITVTTVDEVNYVTAISDPAALAKAAAAIATDDLKKGSVTVAENGNTAVFPNLEDGYWLITSTLGTIAMTETTPDKAAVTINEKNPEDTIEKKVQEDSTSAWGDKNDAQIGDPVEFQSFITLQKNTRNVKVHDTMDNGLTLDEESVIIANLAKGTDYTVAYNTDDGCDFEITFTDTYLNALNGETKLTLTYSAVLNEKAVATADNATSIVDQKNTTKITYGDKQSVTDETTTTTHKFSVFKHATGSADNLAGATFQLKKNGTVLNLVMIDNYNYRIAKDGETGTVDKFTTGADKNIVIWGVDSDNDYTLVETQAPEGYNQLSQSVLVNWTNADSNGNPIDINNTVVDVENKSGTELPSTGGVGTTMFYIFGGVLVVAAVVLLVAKKRMASAK